MIVRSNEQTAPPPSNQSSVMPNATPQTPDLMESKTSSSTKPKIADIFASSDTIGRPSQLQAALDRSSMEHPSSSNSSVSAWLNLVDSTKSPNNALETQKQRLNQLVELISNQEAKLNRLKALRKLAKEQTAINVELTNELKTVNNCLGERDSELRQALNKVDNLSRQLNNFRRTRAYRNSKNVPANKLVTSNNDNISNRSLLEEVHSNVNGILHTNKTDNHNSSSNGGLSCDNTYDLDSSNTIFQTFAIEELADASSSSTNFKSAPILDKATVPDDLDLKQISSDLIQNEDQQVKQGSETVNRIASKSTSSCPDVVQNYHSSPALNKYNSARQKMMNTGAKPNILGRRVSFDPLALLLDAALEGELDLVIQTSKQVPDLSASHDECVTALHNAVVAGHYEVAKYLIEAGCDINVQDSDGWTPLHCAASCNNLTLVKLLIENGALIYATTTSDNSTPAMKCEQSEEGFEDCYKYLLYVQNNLGVINGGVVYALYDYDAQEKDELSFTTNEELIVLRRDDSQEQQWWWAQKRIERPSDTIFDIKEGYIPRNLVGLYRRVKASKSSKLKDSNGSESVK